MGGPASAASQVSPASRRSDQDQREGALVGVEPVGNLVMMENHDGAYYAWRRAGITDRILLHIDAHIDWNWIADRDPLEIIRAQTLEEIESMLEDRYLWNLSERKSEELVHIGNYICPALREGIVREFYWIVPDGAMENPREHRRIVRMFKGMARMNPRGLKDIRPENNAIVAEIYGKKVTICSLSALPEIREPVLLDIDTDFLLAGSVDGDPSGDDLWRQPPWIWPEELVERLREKGLRTDFVTLAYSVEGGFTPLSYKYLGDELALRLQHATLPARQRQLMAHKRGGACYRYANELDKAVREYEAAVDLAPEDASSHFNLAYLYDEKRSYERAAARYRQAVQLDPTYATAYNNFGPVYHSLGMREKAEQEYQRILRWDPRNGEAHYGLAQILSQKKRWDEAMLQYRKVLEYRPDHARAHRGLGYAYAKRGMWDDAVMQLQRAIALQPYDGGAHFWLGASYARQKRWDEAIGAYRAALRRGIRNVAIYMRLGRAYLGKGAGSKALKSYRKGLRMGGWFALLYLGEVSKRFLEKLARGFSSAQGKNAALQERESPLANH